MQGYVFLYGYNDVSVEKLQKLVQAGVNAKGIIDLRAEELRKQTISPELIFSVEEVEKINRQTECIVVILLQNGFLHTEVAQHLYEKGIMKILGLQENAVTDFSIRMSLLYNDFLMDDFTVFDKLPDYESVSGCKDCNILYQSNRRIIASVPIHRIFWYMGERIQKQLGLLSVDIPLVSAFPYFELWKFCEGKSRECQSYLDTLGLLMKRGRKDWDDSKVLKTRMDYYLYYVSRFDSYRDWFVSAAPFGKWEDGKFDCIDGNHRATFLVYKGMYFIPMSMSVEDYYQWMQEENSENGIFFEDKTIGEGKRNGQYAKIHTLLCIAKTCGGGRNLQVKL